MNVTSSKRKSVGERNKERTKEKGKKKKKRKKQQPQLVREKPRAAYIYISVCSKNECT